MKKLIAFTLTATMLTATAAQADYYGRRGGYRAPAYNHHQHRAPAYNHRGNNWVAPVIGGLLLGGALYGAHRYYQPQPVCWDEVVGYDRYGREVWQRLCQ